jgi:TonB family protein
MRHALVEIELAALEGPRIAGIGECRLRLEIHQGGKLPQEVDAPPRKLSGSSPSYPSERARRLRSGERVSVIVSFVITEDGEVRDATVLESGGRALDDVVVAAVRGWKYQPAQLRGTRVKFQMTFKQTFLGG